MKKLIKKYLDKADRKRIKTRRLENHLRERVDDYSYREFAQAVEELLSEGAISPIKARGQNGRVPELYNWYRIEVSTPEMDEELKKELLASYHPQLNLAYYHQHPEEYKSDKPYLKILDKFFRKSGDRKEIRVRERSFQLFSDEKFLTSSLGQQLLSRVSLNLSDLNCSSPAEPFFYYYQETNPPVENILIIENKDTFFSLKQLLREGVTGWDGLSYSLLIYGEGKKIQRSFSYLEELNYYSTSLEELNIYYFGDLDPEGIFIWHKLRINYEVEIKPAQYFYRQLINHYLDQAPRLEKEHNFNQQAIEEFLHYFSKPVGEKIESLLASERYIPQEGLNYQLLKELSSD